MNVNKLWFPWKPVHVQLGTISENTRIGDCYRCAKFHACIKKCVLCRRTRADHTNVRTSLLRTLRGSDVNMSWYLPFPVGGYTNTDTLIQKFTRHPLLGQLMLVTKHSLTVSGDLKVTSSYSDLSKTDTSLIRRSSLCPFGVRI